MDASVPLSARTQSPDEANSTVLLGDLDNNDTTDGPGVVTSMTHIAGDNVFRVVYATGLAPQATTLDGFTITDVDALNDGERFCRMVLGSPYECCHLDID